MTKEENIKSVSAKKPWAAILPLVLFLAIAGASYSLLSTEGRDASALPSALLDKPAPKLSIPPLDGLMTSSESPVPGVEPSALLGKVSIVNIFASWCVPCRQEHPQIVELASDSRIQMVGINHKDSTKNALAFLAELGNPYDMVGVDRAGRASIEWGVYGIPETFLVNREGRIIFKHVGPISEKDLENIFKPLIEDALKSGT